MLELVLRITFSLAIVFGLMWGLARVLKKPLTGRHSGAALDVLSRAQLSRGSSVALIRVVDRALIVGVTEGQVTLLGETDLAAVERQLAGPLEKRNRITLPEHVRPGEDLSGEGAEDSVIVERPSDGGAASGRTWAQTLNFLRERTVRR
ncbi:FliO/MopB family protein [Catenuloplanes indicus]|uniref:Flagellar protein FliO/FliZ n=1 Tax=Catenuloplanes indicus TaxID=137267 RepID=A0AAE4AZA0_9ACTN|nr:flagellar biosynthetic protein FliO [Catenuloplanes indicus]MDQ0368222.1 flagellar protein FliO/FliZ [Catenuloplanes indicus]